VQSTDAERSERPLVLETAELTLDGWAPTVQGGEPGASRAGSAGAAGRP
jgi:hypothetical protein